MVTRTAMVCAVRERMRILSDRAAGAQVVLGFKMEAPEREARGELYQRHAVAADQHDQQDQREVLEVRLDRVGQLDPGERDRERQSDERDPRQVPGLVQRQGGKAVRLEVQAREQPHGDGVDEQCQPDRRGESGEGPEPVEKQAQTLGPGRIGRGHPRSG